MEKLLRFLKGYVRIQVTGEQTERFLNLCRSRGIVIRRLNCPGCGCLTGIISIRDFFLLAPIRRKTKVHIRVHKKCGMPFFFFRSKKRKAFFTGMLLCLCLMAFLSGRIWNIHIEGNLRNSTPEILSFLDEEGIVHGIAKKKVNCSRLAALVRKKYPEITWVSARIEGTRLILTIQEGEEQEVVHDTEQEPCSLAASSEGTIVKMITRSGIPVVKEGDSCKKGDLLVLGRLEVKNDSQEVVRYSYVHADADVYIRRELSYFDEFPLEYDTEIPAGKTKQGFCLRIGNWYLEIGGNALDGWRKTVFDEPLRVTENFVLPVSVGTIVLEQYQSIHSIYTEKQAKLLAVNHLQNYEKELLQKGIQILENRVITEVKQDTCVSKGTLVIVEKTGKEIRYFL